jgi:hypothetical protein
MDIETLNGLFIVVCLIFLIYFALKKKSWNSFVLGFGFALITDISSSINIWITHPLFRDVFMEIVIGSLTFSLPIITLAAWFFVVVIRWIKRKIDLNIQKRRSDSI